MSGLSPLVGRSRDILQAVLAVQVASDCIAPDGIEVMSYDKIFRDEIWKHGW